MKVLINGFGRIGRCIVRAAFESKTELEILGINDLTDAKTLAHLLKYDSVHGIYRGGSEVVTKEVEKDGKTTKEPTDVVKINGKEVKITAHKDVDKLIEAWKDKAKEADIIFECTGIYKNLKPAKDGSQNALVKMQEAFGKPILMSAPLDGAHATFVYGVNHTDYKPAEHKIMSNASCTTNCLAPVAYVLLKEFGLNKGYVTTIHSYTNDQKILDQPHADLRRARAGALSMIPTKTGAAKAIGLVIPELIGKMDGLAVRVPTPNVSLVDLVAELPREVTTDEINAAMKKYAEGELKGVLRYCDEELVSIDFNGDLHSSIYYKKDSGALGKKSNMVKILSWYDNEMGYSMRMLDTGKYIVSKN